jgi:hypothetical protein
MANNRGLRVLIVLFVGAVALSIIYPWLIQRTPGHTEPTIVVPPTAIPLIFEGILPTDITRITIESRQTGHSVTLVRIPGNWTATDETGKSISVDLNLVTKMISILPTLRYNRSMNESNLKDFGLADGGEFTVQFEAGRLHTLHIGAISADGTLSYCQRDSESAVLWVSVQPIATLVSIVSEPVKGSQTATLESTLFNSPP